MRLLLDTHAFLWFVGDDDRLSAPARRAIERAGEAYVSVASCWEMAMKVSIGKLRVATPIDRFLPEQLAANDFELLHVDLPHALRVARLPWHHRDPFDRLLVSQALEERLAIVSADPVMRRYGAERIW